jgi:hypothetical protein
MFMSQYPGVMVSSSIDPTAEGNFAIKTVELFAEYDIVVCVVKTGARISDPIVGTDVDVAESMNSVRPPAAPFCPAGPVGPMYRVLPAQLGADGPLICD